MREDYDPRKYWEIFGQVKLISETVGKELTDEEIDKIVLNKLASLLYDKTEDT